jgi:hypothetical protein
VPSPQHTQAPYNTDAVCDFSDVVLFSCNSILSGIYKTFFLDKHGDVYTNMLDYKAVMSCAPYQTPRKTPGTGGPYQTPSGETFHNQGSFFPWLFEYLRRLEEGIYQVEPADLTDPDHIGPHPVCGISLFPTVQPLQQDELNAHEHINPTAPQPQARMCVTNGVEVVNSAVFVPSDCDLRGFPRTLFWTYSMRLRLLHNHPSRPPRMGRCACSSRTLYPLYPSCPSYPLYPLISPYTPLQLSTGL